MAQRGEGQGLQIAVISFAMLTIILAITTYVFYAQASTAQKDLQAKNKSLLDKQTENNKLMYRVRAMQYVLGLKGTAKEDVDQAKTQAGGDDPEVKEILDNFDADSALVGDQVVPAGPKSYRTINTVLLAALNKKTGDVIWKVDTLKEFNAKNLFFGVSTSPTVVGDVVVVMVGGKGAESDVEILLMLVAFLGELGFADLKVLVNTVGDGESRVSYREKLKTYLLPWRERLSEDSRRRLDTNPLRILDSKSPEEQEIVAAAPKLADSLTEVSRRHFAAVLSSLEVFGLTFQVEPRLVRGLDYYTNTVFEIVSEGLGAQNAICGGGAYEGLIAELGGDPTYGVGFAIGEDRLLEVLPAHSPARAAAKAVRPVLVAWAGGKVVDAKPSDGL